MSKRVKSVLRTALLVFASLVLGVNIYLWNARSLTGNALPMPFGYGAAVVLTGSMEPSIMTDDLILVKAGEDYSVGDVVVYQSGTILVVHRIVELSDEMATTKGDANNVADAPVSRAAIKGEVIASIPRMGALARFLKSPVVTVLLLAAAIVLPEISRRREQQRDIDELEKIKEEIRHLKAEQE